MEENVTISELTPNLRGPFVLRFEVVFSLPSADNPQEISLKIADQTGCINAYFNNLGQHIKTGQVYELHSFKCKVVDHSLRVQLTKESKINRVKHDMAFKDLVNNLSEKFYATKAQQQSIEQPNVQPLKEAKPLVNSSKQVPQKDIPPQENLPSNKVSEEKTKQKQEVEVKEKVMEEKNEQGRQSVPEEGKKVKKEYKEKKDSKEETNQKKEDEKPAKKKYVLKKIEETSQTVDPQKKQESESKQSQRVFLKDIWQFREKDINLFVQVELKTEIVYNKYILVRACDSSGSTYVEFDRRTHLENKAWYCLRRFKVFGDKDYGFVASQQQYSTYDLLDEYNEIPEHRPIYFPKPK